MDVRPLTDRASDKVEHWLEETMDDMEPIGAHETTVPSTSSSPPAQPRSLHHHFITNPPAKARTSSKVISSQRGDQSQRGGRNGRGRGRAKNMSSFDTLLPARSQGLTAPTNNTRLGDEKTIPPLRNLNKDSSLQVTARAVSKTSTPAGLGGQTGNSHRNHAHIGSTSGSASPQLHHPRAQFSVRPGRPRVINPLKLAIGISALPSNISCTTFTFYELFKQYGNISYIHVHSAPRTAYLIFRPAPQDVSWLGRLVSHKYVDIEGKTSQIAVRTWDKSNPMAICKSPEGNRTYPEQTYLPVASIDFGVMNSENSMMIMNSLDGVPNMAHLQLDLKKKHVLLTFNIELPAIQPFPSVTRTFMIQLDIAQMHEMNMVQGSDNFMSVIMTIDNPPEIYRRASNIQETHDEDVINGEWNEYNAWYRQTDIDTNPAGRNGPVQLHKTACILDTARWLTYRMKFAPTVASSGLFRDLYQALADHNVRPDLQKNIEYTHGDMNTSWAWMDSLFRTQGGQDSTSSPLDLQRMVETVHLTFAVQYQLEVCLSIGVLHECNINVDFLARMAALEPRRAVKILEKVADRKERIYNPESIFDLGHQVSVAEKQRPGYCARIPSATVTPTTLYFSTPALETSNRVVRHFKSHEDRFLRVKFNDEKHKGALHSQEDRVMDEIFSRVYRAMTHGIVVGDRHYEFLAFGNSQFREHGAYFFASTEKVTAATIRDWMGDFTQFNNVAKYISRLGLCFTTTRGIPYSVTVQRIADVERNGHIFTDGVGRISPLLADLIATHYKLDYRPSVFQFRMAGCKGVLAVDPSVRGMSVQIRPSQDKFPAPYFGLEIAKTSKFTSANLNVQLILVLSALGIPDGVFMKKLRTMLVDMETAMTDETLARKLLEKNIDYSQMTLSLSQAIGDGFMQTQEPFIISWLRLWRSWSLKYLKEKARIFVEQGAYVFGVTDETGTLRGHFDDGGETFNAEKETRKNETLAVANDKSLEFDREKSTHTSVEDADDEPITGSDSGKPAHQSRNTAEESAPLPEIFIQVPDPDAKGGYTVIEAICLLTRSPTLHPGDVRVVRAVNVPALHHLKDCVVLPQTGDRDLANMCSGGDLDGDEYVVCWDPALIPQQSKWNHPAMDFSTAKPPPREGPVTLRDMAAFFVNHIKNDQLGKIAVAHKLWADRSDNGVQNEKCIELAELHSQAVDYPKTGVPAKLPGRLRVKVRPHWAEPRGGSYVSKKIIGQLYDAINLDNFKPAWELPFDQRILNACVPSQQNLEDAKEIKDLYDESMRRIMAQYGIKNEFEVFTTFVQEHHQDLGDYKFAETIDEVSASLRGQFMEQCYVKAGTTARDRDWVKMKPFLVAMYTITAQEVSAAVAESTRMVMRSGRHEAQQALTFDNVPFMSFPWIFGRDLASIATRRDRNGTSSSHIAKARPTLPVDKKLAKSQAMAALYGKLEPLAEVYMPEGGTLHMGDVMNLHHQRARNDAVGAMGGEASIGIPKQAPPEERTPLSSRRLALTEQSKVGCDPAKDLSRDKQEKVGFQLAANADDATQTIVPVENAVLPASTESTEALDLSGRSNDGMKDVMNSFPNKDTADASEEIVPLSNATVVAAVKLECKVKKEDDLDDDFPEVARSSMGGEVPVVHDQVNATIGDDQGHMSGGMGDAECSSGDENEIEEEEVQIVFDQVPSSLLD